MEASPSLHDFLSTARREFAFLVAEIGFVEQPDTREHPNPFCVRYVSPRAAVTVEGISWGVGIQVIIAASDGQFAMPLWAIAEARGILYDSASGQLARLAHAAILLRTGVADVVRGDFSSFPAVMRVIEHHSAESAIPMRRKLP